MKQKPLSIKRIKEDPILSAIKRGQFSRKRKPEVIKHLKLSVAIKLISRQRLAKEIAYAMCTTHSERLINERYRIAYNCLSIRDWTKVAVVQTSKEVLRFSDILSIDFTQVDSDVFRQEESLFISILLEELKILGRIVL